MGLARPAVAQRNHILPPRDIAAARQLQNQQLVQGRDRSKVKAVQALHTREARLTNAPLNQPPLAVQQLKFAQAEQIAGVVDPPAAHCRASLSYSRKKVGSFSALR